MADYSHRSLLVMWLLLGLFASGCSDPECGEDEKKIGKTCIFTGHASAREGGAADDASEPGLDAGSRGSLDASLAPAMSAADAGQAPVLTSDAAAPSDASMPAPCYLDRDGDGAGSPAEPVDCALFPADGGGPLHAVTNAGDCDDHDPKRAPGLTDLCGDAIDNDCNDAVDDKLNNACGGPCLTGLAHQPGQPCDNGGVGACARAGVYVCQGTTGTVCNASAASPTTETCNSIDDDCDGTVDDGLFNECGGACTLVLTHKPGETCTNEQLGACKMSGTLVCQADGRTICNAPKMKPGRECANPDAVDNDCDGTVDDLEPFEDIFGCKGDSKPPTLL